MPTVPPKVNRAFEFTGEVALANAFVDQRTTGSATFDNGLVALSATTAGVTRAGGIHLSSTSTHPPASSPSSAASSSPGRRRSPPISTIVTFGGARSPSARSKAPPAAASR